MLNTNDKPYNVYSKFDIEMHKKTFVNYLEAIILPSGEVQYAVPSHVEKLILLTGEKREDFFEKMPISASPIDWLLDYTGCISLWSDFHKGNPTTKEQKETLKLLIREGLTE